MESGTEQINPYVLAIIIIGVTLFCSFFFFFAKQAMFPVLRKSDIFFSH